MSPPPPPPGDDIAAVILAAGSSFRLGRNKLMGLIDGEPLVRRVTRRVLASGVTTAVVVVGHEAERVAGAVEGLPCQIATNTRHREDGADGSLRVGLSTGPDDIRGVLVVLADMPLVEEAMFRAVVEAFDGEAHTLVASDYGGVLAPPMLYGRGWIEPILAMSRDGEVRELVDRLADRALRVSMPPEALRDVDTPADARELGLRTIPPSDAAEDG